MIDGLLELPPHLRKRLASALDAGLLAAPYSEVATKTALSGGTEEQVLAATRSLGKLGEIGVVGRAAAAWLRAAEQVESRRPRTDLVWTGPEVPGLHARDTRRVYEELLGTAERSVWASSYAYFDGPKAFEILARRMDERPELEVTILLNIQRRKGDTSAADSLVRKFADRFWGHDWPGTRRPRVFYDPRSIELNGKGGVLHAKAVVTDDEILFVTSANLTEAALDKNIEVGLLHRDRALAQSLVKHFATLIDRGLLLLLPGS